MFITNGSKMGCLCDKVDDNDEHINFNEKNYVRRRSYFVPKNSDRKKSAVGKLAYNTFSSANGVVNTGSYLDPDDMNEQIRLAKCQMKTVTVRNNYLYFDYEFVGRILPGSNINIY